MKKLFRLLLSGIGMGLISLSLQGATLSTYDLRYLFLVETSQATEASREVIAEAVTSRVRTGFNGEFRAGDIFSVWTFGSDVSTEQFLPMTWNPRLTQVLSERLQRALQSQRFEGITRPDKAMRELSRAVLISDALTVFIIGSGRDPIKGTPFDGQINEAYQANARRLGYKPAVFVTQLMTRDGHVMGWSVEPLGGAPIQPTWAGLLPAAVPASKPAPALDQTINPLPKSFVPKHSEIQAISPMTEVPKPPTRQPSVPSNVASHPYPNRAIEPAPRASVASDLPLSVTQSNPLKPNPVIAAHGVASPSGFVPGMEDELRLADGLELELSSNPVIPEVGGNGARSTEGKELAVHRTEQVITILPSPSLTKPNVPASSAPAVSVVQAPVQTAAAPAVPKPVLTVAPAQATGQEAKSANRSEAVPSPRVGKELASTALGREDAPAKAGVRMASVGLSESKPNSVKFLVMGIVLLVLAIGVVVYPSLVRTQGVRASLISRSLDGRG